MKESADFAAAYTAEIERKTVFKPREILRREPIPTSGEPLQSGCASSFKSVDGDFADYADAEVRADAANFLPDESVDFGVEVESESAPNRDIRVYESPTSEFVEAVKKIRPEILRLMRSQFHSSPQRFVQNGIEVKKDDEPESEKISDEVSLEDDTDESED